MGILATKAGSVGYMSSAQRWLFKSPGGNLYQVINGLLLDYLADGEFGPATTTSCVYVNKSTDGGATWTDVTGGRIIDTRGSFGTIPNTEDISFGGISCTQVGEVIYIAYRQYNTGFFGPRPPIDQFVARLNTLSDSWLADLVPPTQGSYSEPADIGQFALSLSAKSNGKLQLSFANATETVGIDVCARVYLTEYDGVSAWSTPVLIPGQAGASVSFIPGQHLVSSTNRLSVFLIGAEHFYGPDSPTPLGIYQISQPDAGSWGTLQQIASDLAYLQDTGDPSEASAGSFSPTGLGMGIAYTDSTNIDRLAVPYATFPGGYPGPSSPAPIMRVLQAEDADVPAWSVATVSSAVNTGGNDKQNWFNECRAAMCFQKKGTSGHQDITSYVIGYEAFTTGGAPVLIPPSTLTLADEIYHEYVGTGFGDDPLTDLLFLVWCSDPYSTVQNLSFIPDETGSIQYSSYPPGTGPWSTPTTLKDYSGVSPVGYVKPTGVSIALPPVALTPSNSGFCYAYVKAIGLRP